MSFLGRPEEVIREERNEAYKKLKETYNLLTILSRPGNEVVGDGDFIMKHVNKKLKHVSSVYGFPTPQPKTLQQALEVAELYIEIINNHLNKLCAKYGIDRL